MDLIANIETGDTPAITRTFTTTTYEEAFAQAGASIQDSEVLLSVQVPERL